MKQNSKRAKGGLDPFPLSHNDARHWLDDMARETGFMDEGLVKLAEAPLMEKQLILPRTLGDGSGIRWGLRNRLTSLGERVCEFMNG